MGTLRVFQGLFPGALKPHSRFLLSPAQGKHVRDSRVAPLSHLTEQFPHIPVSLSNLGTRKLRIQVTERLTEPSPESLAPRHRPRLSGGSLLKTHG